MTTQFLTAALSVYSTGAGAPKPFGVGATPSGFGGFGAGAKAVGETPIAGGIGYGL
jgi:hypothetical protein